MRDETLRSLDIFYETLAMLDSVFKTKLDVGKLLIQVVKMIPEGQFARLMSRIVYEIAEHP
jgi:hypothetical protein